MKGDAPESFIQWLLANSFEEGAIRDVAVFIRIAESAPRAGSLGKLADWIREHGSPARLAHLEEAGRLWAVRRRAEPDTAWAPARPV